MDVYRFPKNQRSNIEREEKEALKELADELLSLTPEQIELSKNENKLIEVDCEAEMEIGDA